MRMAENLTTMSETVEPRPEATADDRYAEEIHAWKAERTRVRRLDRDYEPDVLAPPPCFGPNDGGDAVASPTVKAVLRSGNAGSNDPITPQRLQAALTATTPDYEHGRALLSLLNEAEVTAILMAHDEGAYTWRRLANAVHVQRITHHAHFRVINRQAMA